MLNSYPHISVTYRAQLGSTYQGVSNLINMDGIEWKRAKWSRPAGGV
jgi:hypothetical protein